ncbi:MAG: ATP-binding cassette domain-containing protein [Desulfobacteraceae bacterium]
MGVSPVLRLGRFSYAFSGGADFVLREISLDVYPGQCHCLTGPSGCGKTTLLMAIRGLLPPGRQDGTLDIPQAAARNGTAAAGIVFQNPVTQLISPALGAEVAFGMENHCIAPEQMPARVCRALADAGLDYSVETPVAILSMGQQYRACVAGALVMEPAIILLDEPGAQLDPDGLRRLMQTIAHLKSMGKAILVCEHRPGFLADVFDHYWRFTPEGRLTAGLKAQVVAAGLSHGTAFEKPSALDGDPPPAMCESAGDDGHRNSSAPAIQALDLAIPGYGDGSRRSLLNFSLAEGRRAILCGPNGAGKTTLVNYLTGLSEPSEGSVEVMGAAPAPGRLRGAVGVLFQNPRRQLFGTTVFEEVAFAARRCRRHRSPEDISVSVRTLLELLDLGGLADRSPHRLSYGQKHLVSLAAVLAGEPRLLILDDPLAGLDDGKARKVLELLARLNEKEGTTILCTSHHPEPWDDWAHLFIRLSAGQEKSVNDAAFLPGNNAFQATAGIRKAVLPLPTGTALVMSILLCMAAFTARSVLWLAVLTGINLLLLFLRCAGPWPVLRRSVRFFVWQAVIITLLYGLRFGWQSGAVSGLCVAWQLFLAFWPGMVFTASNPTSRVTRSLARVLPHQTAFVVSACLRFLPLLLEEMNAIRQAQIYRGAGLLRQDIRRLRLWPDWVHCLLVPTLVRALSLAADIALAAEARDFGLHKQRTHWPGDAG